ncbi:hypothetical protein KSP39_PZI018313 [Platanthera zijinensis]|uniref:Uncharacterized protein n=1 Tax=Platanthera zijinensis TaxID=2320716 RepID=A0AAP0B370_9ASPA
MDNEKSTIITAPETNVTTSERIPLGKSTKVNVTSCNDPVHSAIECPTRLELVTLIDPSAVVDDIVYEEHSFVEASDTPSDMVEDPLSQPGGPGGARAPPKNWKKQSFNRLLRLLLAISARHSAREVLAISARHSARRFPGRKGSNLDGSSRNLDDPSRFLDDPSRFLDDPSRFLDDPSRFLDGSIQKSGWIHPEIWMDPSKKSGWINSCKILLAMEISSCPISMAYRHLDPLF